MTANEIIAMLDLAPHPEGGWYRETWRAPTKGDARASGTSIYFLLAAEQFSHWHRVDAAEIWHWYAGAPLVLSLSENGHDAEAAILGPELTAGQRPQRIVPAGWWQSATSLGAWTLVGCTVSPGFQFAGFELAPPDWRPTRRGSTPRGD
ncbi:cupin domain-containing protein [Pontivivens nitratireducens]|uniref:Cupin domain-containing protein n=1 Tax=Pontivivens nitratireducens TaxID=2758038 RepID=A0A6G7VNC0_9RHOB|nr:cupin domain-containing protein [Pontibrevibacter nitratireducens]QIK41583.1 cupin domain-containing protein [Pontibrevibacter nitratireducens]